jgi:sarcosine oxidase, subunit gamma
MAEHDQSNWIQPGHRGAPETGVVFAETTIATAWNVQGRASRTQFIDEARRLFGIALPVAPNTVARGEALTAFWLGPASWLLVAGGAAPLVDFNATRDALNAAGGALFDVSASRVAWRISGPHAVTVLAKGCPLDFHPRAFAERTCAQSVYGHANAHFVREDEAETFTMMVARSFARDVWHALTTAAAQYGYNIRTPAPYR